MPRRCFAFALLAVMLCGGCAHQRKPRVIVKPVKPWITAKSLCMLPMTRPPPRPGAVALAEVIEEGWKARLDVPEDAELVHIEPGAGPGAFDAIRVDLSGSRVDPGRRHRMPAPQARSSGRVRAERLTFIADPLLVDQARVRFALKATDATLDVRRDGRTRRQLLTLTDAREGRLSLEVQRRDLDRLLLQGARAGAGKYGVTVDRTELGLDVIGDRSVLMDLKVDARVGFLPAGLHFQTRVDIDDRLDATMTRLDCRGTQVLGPIISAFIRPGLKKFEGKTRPLIGFEWGRMKLHDIAMRSGDSFRLEAEFGSGDGAEKPTARRPRTQVARSAARDGASTPAR